MSAAISGTRTSSIDNYPPFSGEMFAARETQFFFSPEWSTAAVGTVGHLRFTFLFIQDIHNMA
jgi:hypothetical protein